jgi:hypothetical protein
MIPITTSNSTSVKPRSADDRLCLGPGTCENGQKQARDDRDDDQQLDECEAVSRTALIFNRVATQSIECPLRFGFISILFAFQLIPSGFTRHPFLPRNRSKVTSS